MIQLDWTMQIFVWTNYPILVIILLLCMCVCVCVYTRVCTRENCMCVVVRGHPCGVASFLPPFCVPGLELTSPGLLRIGLYLLSHLKGLIQLLLSDLKPTALDTADQDWACLFLVFLVLNIYLHECARVCTCTYMHSIACTLDVHVEGEDTFKSSLFSSPYRFWGPNSGC